jgi:hypothetical protein
MHQNNLFWWCFQLSWKKEFHQFSFVFKMKLFVSRQLKASSKQVVSTHLSAAWIHTVFFSLTGLPRVHLLAVLSYFSTTKSKVADIHLWLPHVICMSSPFLRIGYNTHLHDCTDIY